MWIGIKDRCLCQLEIAGYLSFFFFKWEVIEMRMLKNIKPNEVSLVGNPANRRPFLFVKENIEMKNLIAIIKEFVSDFKFEKDNNEWEGTEQVDKDAVEAYLSETTDEYEEFEKAGLDEKVKNALRGALNIINKFKAALPADLKSALIVLTRYIANGGGKYPYPAPYKKGDLIPDIPVVDYVENIAKAGRKLSTDTIKEIKSVIESLNKLLPLEEEKPVAKSDTKELQDTITKSIDGLATKITEETLKISERLLKLENADSESKKLDDKKDDEEVKKSDDKHPYPTVEEALFGIKA